MLDWIFEGIITWVSSVVLPRRSFEQYREKETYGDVSANAVGKKKSLPLIY